MSIEVNAKKYDAIGMACICVFANAAHWIYGFVNLARAALSLAIMVGRIVESASKAWYATVKGVTVSAVGMSKRRQNKNKNVFSYFVSLRHLLVQNFQPHHNLPHH